MCVLARRIVSTDKILRFINTFIIIIKAWLSNLLQQLLTYRHRGKHPVTSQLANASRHEQTLGKYTSPARGARAPK